MPRLTDLPTDSPISDDALFYFVNRPSANPTSDKVPLTDLAARIGQINSGPAPATFGMEPVFNIADPAFGGVKNDASKGAANFSALSAALAAAGANGGGCVFIPAGVWWVTPQAGTWLKISSNTALVGCGPCSELRVTPNAGDYPVLFSAPTFDTVVTDIWFQDFQVNQNGAANGTGDLDSNDINKAQVAVYFRYHTGLRVTRMLFRYCGVWAVGLPYGSGSRDTLVQGSTFEFHRTRSTFGIPQGGFYAGDYDSTAVYSEAHDTRIVGNSFYAPPAAFARGSIELHANAGLIADNVVRNFAAGPGVVTHVNAGDQLVKSQVQITGNSVYSYGYGIYFGALTGKTLSNVTITGNTVHVDGTTSPTNQYPFIKGITLLYGPGVWDGVVDGVTVADNVVTFAYESAGGRTTNAQGMPLETHSNGGVILYGNIPVRNCRVTGNTVVGAPEAGVLVGFAGSPLNAAVENVVVSDNLIVDAGQNVGDGVTNQDQRAAIVLQQCPMTNVHVRGNVIRDNGRPGTGNAIGYRSVYAALPTVAADCRVADNPVSVKQGFLIHQVDVTKIFTGDIAVVFDGVGGNPDPLGPVAAGAELSRTILTYAGVSPGDQVAVTILGADLGDFTARAFVSAVGTIVLRLRNNGPAPVTPSPAFVWCFKVTKRGV